MENWEKNRLKLLQFIKIGNNCKKKPKKYKKIILIKQKGEGKNALPKSKRKTNNIILYLDKNWKKKHKKEGKNALP